MSLDGLPVTSSRMLRAPVPTEVHRPGNSASTAVHSADTTLAALIDISEFVPNVLDRVGLSSKQACAYMKLDRSQWSKQLKGRDNHQVSLQKMAELPLAFWFEFAIALCEKLGLAVGHPDMTHLALARVLELAGEVARLASVQQTLRRA